MTFENTLPEDQKDKGYGAKIVARELGQIVAWGLEGARRLVAQGHFTETAAHGALMARWRVAANNVASFVEDVRQGEVKDFRMATEAELADADIEWPFGTEIYKHYTKWCGEARRTPYGRNNFYGRLTEVPGVQVLHPPHKARTVKGMVGDVF